MIDLVGKLALQAFDLIQSRLSIVLFHRVLAAPDPLLPDEPDVARFAEQVRWLKRCFRILPLRDAPAAAPDTDPQRRPPWRRTSSSPTT